MANDKNSSSWLVVATLLGAGIAGKAVHDSTKKKKQAEQLRVEQEQLERKKLEQERLAHENSFGHKLGQFFEGILQSVEYKTEEARENARAVVSSKSDEELEKLADSDNTFISEAAIEEMKQRNPYGLKKYKPRK